MANDHYVAQTYLNNFSGPDGLLVPYYKKGQVIVGKRKSPKSVCYVPDGNTNTFFSDPRILEQFITPLEKNWNDNLRRLEAGQCDPDTRYEIAAYLSYLRIGTPTALKQSQGNLAGLVKSTAKVMAAQGLFYNDKFSKEFNEARISEIMNDDFEVKVNAEYAHARNISTLNNLSFAFCNSDWKVLFDRGGNILTGDNPFCLYDGGKPVVDPWAYIPLRPDMALLMRSNLDSSDMIRQGRAAELPHGTLEYGRVKAKFLYRFNECLVRHAEEKVFYNKEADWVTRLVKLNRDWNAIALVDSLPTGDGYVNITRHRVRKNKTG